MFSFLEAADSEVEGRVIVVAFKKPKLVTHRHR